MGDVPVALVSGAATVAAIATDVVGSLDYQVIKLDIGAPGASNQFVGGQADPENSISIIGASGAFFNVKASVLGNVNASVAGHVLASVEGTHPVTITGAIFASAQVSVLGNVAASVAGHVAVSVDGTPSVAIAGAIFASAQVSVVGNVNTSVAGHVAVSVDGTLNIISGGASAGATANGMGTLVMGVDGASAQRFFLTDTIGRTVVAVSAGQIIASVQGNVATSVAGHVAVSVDGTPSFAVAGAIFASAQVSVLGHALVSVDGTPSVAVAGAIFASAQVSVLGNVAASVAGHVLVSVDGTPSVAIAGAIFASAQVSVLGNVAASVAGHVLVSADGTIDVSAHGIVSAAGHVLVSGDGHFAVSADGHALVSGDGTFLAGLTAASGGRSNATDGNRVDALGDLQGRQIVTMFHARAMVSLQSTTLASASTGQVFVSAPASHYYDISHLSITNSSTSAATVELTERGAGGGTNIRAKWVLTGGGGFVSNWSHPFNMKTAGAAWFVSANTQVNGNVEVVMQCVDNV